MRSTRTQTQALAAIAAGLMTLSALPALAAPQAHSQAQQGHANDRSNSGQTRPGQPTKSRPAQSQPAQNHHAQNRPSQGSSNANANTNARHGTWNTSWGARPPAPPTHFTRVSDWNRHVHACQVRYRSYNPRTDTFVPRIGQTAICRL